MTDTLAWTLPRRQFVAIPAVAAGAALTGFAQTVLAQRAPLTAGQVVDRVKQNLGVPWRDGPTDTFKTGDVSTPITGIATTVMSTFDVIRKAATAKANMVITHEPTFWTGNDSVQGFVKDAVYLQKLQFIRDNNIVVWRFHDNRMPGSRT